MAWSAGRFSGDIFDRAFFAMAIQTIPGVSIGGLQSGFCIRDMAIEDFHRFGRYIGC